MKLQLLTIFALMMCVMANAQSKFDLNKPFGFCTMSSRTDKSATYEMTGGGGYIYKDGKVVNAKGKAVDAESVKVLKATDVKSDNDIKNAVKKYSVVVLDGSAGDFVISESIGLKDVKDKTILGINNARLCTKWFVTPEIHETIKAGGAFDASTSGGGGELDNHVQVKERAEFLTRKAIMDKSGDLNETYRKSGIFKLTGENIIIRNLKFIGPGSIDVGGNDLLTATHCKNVWVDHCDFVDGMDGNFDITNSSDFFTVSWCTFSYTERSLMHQNTNLIGGSDKEPLGFLNVTYANCVWGNGCKQRMPMVRVGKVHLLNNYYNCAGSNLSVCVNPRANSEVLLEGNYFSNEIKKSNRLMKIDKAVTSCTIGKGNIAFAALPVSIGSEITVPYKYVIQNVTKMKDDLEKYAGATLE